MKSRKFSIIAIVFACVLGISMIGVGVAASTHLLDWNGSATYTVNSGQGDVTVSYQSQTQGSWSGNTWEIGTVNAGQDYSAELTVTNTHSHSVTVKATDSDSGPSTSQWYYWDGSDYVTLSGSGTTLSTGSTLWLKLTVSINSGASEGTTGSVTIGITAD